MSHTAGTSIASGINILRQGPPAVVCPAQESTIVGNTSSHNQADGIFVGTNSRDNAIHRNTVDGNGLSGIFLGGPAFANQFTNVGPTVFDLVAPDLEPYAQGSDYAVMPGSGSGDVTAPMVAVDLAIPLGDPNPNTNPVDTSTSACEMADFTAAGFQPGDVALVQRGTCTFVSKVANAIAAGASAVVMINEGQAGRTTHQFGSVGPVAIPVLSAEYAVGIELKNLTGAGTVVVHVETNTTNERVQVAPGAVDNHLRDNRGRGNGDFDGEDANPECGTNAVPQLVRVGEPALRGQGRHRGGHRTRSLGWRPRPARRRRPGAQPWRRAAERRRLTAEGGPRHPSSGCRGPSPASGPSGRRPRGKLPVMGSEELRITADDVRELNRAVLCGTARVARAVGTGLLVIGALGAALWLWIVLRQQDVIGSRDGTFAGVAQDPSAAQRLDLVAGSFGYLVSVALTAGAGMALRLGGEHLGAANGGSLTAAAVGDRLPSAADDLAWTGDEALADDGADDEWSR